MKNEKKKENSRITIVKIVVKRKGKRRKNKSEKREKGVEREEEEEKRVLGRMRKEIKPETSMPNRTE